MARLQRKKQTSAKKKAAAGVRPPQPAPGPVAVAVAPEAGKRPAAEKEARGSGAPARRPVVERRPPSGIRLRIDRGVRFLREVKVELKKVTWPSRKQTAGSTVVVIILVLIVSFFMGVVDIGLSGLIRVVLQQG